MPQVSREPPLIGYRLLFCAAAIGVLLAHASDSWSGSTPLGDGIDRPIHIRIRVSHALPTDGVSLLNDLIGSNPRIPVEPYWGRLMLTRVLGEGPAAAKLQSDAASTRLPLATRQKSPFVPVRTTLGDAPLAEADPPQPVTYIDPVDLDVSALERLPSLARMLSNDNPARSHEARHPHKIRSPR